MATRYRPRRLRRPNLHLLAVNLRADRDAAQAEAAELRDARAVAMADALGVTVTKVAMLP